MAELPERDSALLLDMLLAVRDAANCSRPRRGGGAVSDRVYKWRDAANRSPLGGGGDAVSDRVYKSIRQSCNLLYGHTP